MVKGWEEKEEERGWSLGGAESWLIDATAVPPGGGYVEVDAKGVIGGWKEVAVALHSPPFNPPPPPTFF